MFSKRIKNPLDQVEPVKRPFARNVGLTIVFFLIALLGVNMKHIGSFLIIFLKLLLISFFLNTFFINLVQNYKRTDLFYMLISIGGMLSLTSLFIAALTLIGLNGISLLGLLCLYIVSAWALVRIYYKFWNTERLSRRIVSREGSLMFWDLDFDLSEDVKYSNASPINNIVRNILLPFAPAVGMALSRNLEGEQEWLIIGILALLLALNISTLFLKYFALGIRHYFWAKELGVRILRYNK